MPLCAQEHERYCPTPPVTDLCLMDSKKDDEVAMPVGAQEHERYYPTPPHCTPPQPPGTVTDHERAVPVSAGQQER